MQQARFRALAALVLAMVIWGSTYAVTKDTIDDIPPLTLATLRYAVAALVLLPFAIRRGGLAALPHPVPWRTLILMGLTGIALYCAAFNLALVYASAAQGALVQALSPAAIAALALGFLHERLTWRRSVGIALSILGVALVVTASQPEAQAQNPVLGALLMFVTVLAWASYTVLAKRLAQSDEVVVAACVAMIGALLLLPGLALEWVIAPPAAIKPAGWLAILYLGAVCSAACYVIYSYALRHRDASEVGVYTNLVPIVGVAIAVLFLGETLLPLQVAGGAIALIGMWLSS